MPPNAVKMECVFSSISGHSPWPDQRWPARACVGKATQIILLSRWMKFCFRLFVIPINYNYVSTYLRYMTSLLDLYGNMFHLGTRVPAIWEYGFFFLERVGFIYLNVPSDSFDDHHLQSNLTAISNQDSGRPTKITSYVSQSLFFMFACIIKRIKTSRCVFHIEICFKWENNLQFSFD